MAKVAVTGVTGYVGGRLVPELLDAGHDVVCIARSPSKLARRPWLGDVTVLEADVRDHDVLAAGLAGCDVAYYLVHSMDGDGDFAARDRRMAEEFREAATTAGVGRIIYLGGLGAEDDDLSPHLRSRQEVGRTLADGDVPVIELRAAVVIGSGSASFEMLRHLVEVLPVMVTPRWVATRSQPIAIRDVLHYLCAAATLDLDEAGGDGHLVLEIGGPDVVTYRRLMDLYADEAGLRRRVILPVPVLSPSLSSHWVGVVTPLPLGLARPLVQSLINETVADTTLVDRLLPHDCLPLCEAIRLAIRRVEDLAVPSTWADAELGRPGLVRRREAALAEGAWAWAALTDDGDEQAEPQPHDPVWSGGTVLADHQEATSGAPVDALFAQVCSIGGDAGWPVADVLWDVRGWADKAIGGIGMRRGRRHPTELAIGDPLDFWRVEALEEDRLLRLRAEMKVPGEAWLEFRTTPLEGGGSLLQQWARFLPRGLWGRVYWYAMLPAHAVIFPVMARRIAAAAEGRAAPGSTVSQPVGAPPRPVGPR